MQSEDKQISLSDPDARSMATKLARIPRIVRYNVQNAVDTQRPLIVAHDVINVGSDRHRRQARTEMAVDTLEVVADRGYYDGEEIRACDEACITVTLPKPCPAGEWLTYRFTGPRGW